MTIKHTIKLRDKALDYASAIANAAYPVDYPDDKIHYMYVIPIS